ncbi:hypothetical protein AB0P41_14060 [Streptomyces sp. NPDC079167]|uniref:hypothetical protein n=1 Tax=Streptomyces sp. NPDC079167 TaxID=3154513 RepID=UPI0034472568
MPALRMSFASALSVAVLAAGLALGTANPAGAATCPSEASPVAPHGGKAHWKIACTGKGVKVYGWVQDTATDGRCATVTAASDGGPGWIDMVEACGSGVRTNFDWSIPGTRAAKVWLRVVDTD